ncbi:hypothetical protein DRQ53_08145 [bacterium]|nr:MAG: hypothetical protein DRQ32_07810 [bacterium]RKZ15766.1 MAG: hypothetical protein DRQ53_08145 [bacterium]
MLKKVGLLLVAAMVLASTVQGADCTIAAYGDAAGTVSGFYPDLDPSLPLFSFYIVMFAEDSTDAVAYKLNIQSSDIFPWNIISGPSGEGSFLDEVPANIGTNVALGECVLGSGGTPILVAEYVYAALGGFHATVFLSANTNQHPESPIYNTCTNVKTPCDVGPLLLIQQFFPTESTSFSAIKSLYN